MNVSSDHKSIEILCKILIEFITKLSNVRIQIIIDHHLNANN